MTIRNWLLDLADFFNHRMPETQLALFIKDMEEMNLTEAELDSLKRQLIHELDKFPSFAQIYAMGRSTTRVKNAVEPRWRTWRDRDGRPYGQRLPGYQAAIPTAEDLERWKQEACSREESKAAFAKGYLQAGGDPDKLRAMQSEVFGPKKTRGTEFEAIPAMMK